MNQTNLVNSNVGNLIAFWSACGAKSHSTETGSTLYLSNSWPHRVWFNFQDEPKGKDIGLLLQKCGESGGQYKFPHWHTGNEYMHTALLAAGFEVGMTQDLMALRMDRINEPPECKLILKEVKCQNDSSHWALVAGDSFGYRIHEPVITGLIGVPGVEPFIAYDKETAVGTGMLVQTGPIAGIHMIGVPSSHRRKGYARQIMHGLLARAKEVGCGFATLQASAAGKPLYLQLGFESQYPVHTYRQVIQTPPAGIL